MDVEANDHSHGHDHGHGHDHSGEEILLTHDGAGHDDADKKQRLMVLRRLKIASALCCTFFLVEVTGGLLAGSLAILSDAAHLFADLAAFVVAIAASHLAALPPSSAFTFGYKRTEALAALFSMVSLAIVSIFLLVEGCRRLYPYVVSWISGNAPDIDESIEVDGKLMSLIAFIGVVINVILAFVLGEHHVHLPGGDHGHSHDHHDHEDEGEHHSHSHGHSASSSSKHEEQVELIPPTTPDRKAKSKGYGSAPTTPISDLHADEAHSHAHMHQDHGESKKNINLHAAYLHVLGDLAQSVAVLIAGLFIWWKPSWRAIDPICTILFCMVVFYSTIGVIRSSISVLLEEVPPNIDWDQVESEISAVPGVHNVHDLHIWSISHGYVALSVHASADNPDAALSEIHKLCTKHGIGHSTVQIQANGGGNCITCGPGMLHCM